MEKYESKQKKKRVQSVVTFKQRVTEALPCTAAQTAFFRVKFWSISSWKSLLNKSFILFPPRREPWIFPFYALLNYISITKLVWIIYVWVYRLIHIVTLNIKKWQEAFYGPWGRSVEMQLKGLWQGQQLQEDKDKGDLRDSDKLNLEVEVPSVDFTRLWFLTETSLSRSHRRCHWKQRNDHRGFV